MTVVNIGFRGRRAESARELPPGQHLTAEGMDQVIRGGHPRHKALTRRAGVQVRAQCILFQRLKLPRQKRRPALRRRMGSRIRFR